MPRQYVYAVVPAGASTVMGRQSGLEGSAVTETVFGEVAALTSSLGADRVRPSRANLAAHHHIVGLAHAVGPVLPVRFGTVLQGPGSVVDDLLQPNAALFGSRLEEVRGRDEFRLRVTYLPDIPLREVLERSAALRRKREWVLSRRHRVSQGHLIDLGQAVVVELEALRDADARMLLDRIAPTVERVQPLPDRSETVALHAALLVSRGRRETMERAVDALGQSQRDRMKAELVGPLAPWDFIEEAAG